MSGLAAKLVCCLCSYEWILGFVEQHVPGITACPKCEYESSLCVSETFPYFELPNASAD